jgi:hypothetical protein
MSGTVIPVELTRTRKPPVRLRQKSDGGVENVDLRIDDE